MCICTCSWKRRGLGGEIGNVSRRGRGRKFFLSLPDRCCPVVFLNCLLLMIFFMWEMPYCLDDLMQRLPMPLPSEPTLVIHVHHYRLVLHISIHNWGLLCPNQRFCLSVDLKAVYSSERSTCVVPAPPCAWVHTDSLTHHTFWQFGLCVKG